MQRLVCVALLALELGSWPVLAQSTGAIAGRVQDGTTGRYLANARVTVIGLNRERLSKAIAGQIETNSQLAVGTNNANLYSLLPCATVSAPSIVPVGYTGGLTSWAYPFEFSTCIASRKLAEFVTEEATCTRGE